jgi:hypothetical protein
LTNETPAAARVVATVFDVAVPLVSVAEAVLLNVVPFVRPVPAVATIWNLSVPLAEIPELPVMVTVLPLMLWVKESVPLVCVTEVGVSPVGRVSVIWADVVVLAVRLVTVRV